MTINNNITDDYCSFEVSKLLKEKGAVLPTIHHNGNDLYYSLHGENMTNKEGLYTYSVPEKNAISAPTHALAIKWIRENFGFHITTGWHYVENEINWYCRIVEIKDNPKEYEPFLNCETSESATEAALIYTLKNLIQ